jgi:hypothetical protein
MSLFLLRRAYNAVYKLLYSALLCGKMGDERLFFVHARIFGVLFMVEENVAFDSVFAGLFGAKGVVAQGDATRCLTRMASLT